MLVIYKLIYFARFLCNLKELLFIIEMSFCQNKECKRTKIMAYCKEELEDWLSIGKKKQYLLTLIIIISPKSTIN